MTSGLKALSWQRVSLAFASGLLLAAAFPKINLSWLAWIAPGLTLMLGFGQIGKKTFVIGFFAGLGRYLASLYWFLMIPIPHYAFAAWLGMSLVLSLFVGTWCWLCWRVFPRTEAGDNLATATVATQAQVALWPAFCAAAWVAMEMGFAHVLTGFPWNLLGTSQYRLLPLIQIASITGVYGVSFIITWVSAAAALAILHYRKVRIAAAMVALPWLALAVTTWFGWRQLGLPERAAGRLRMALIQPSTPQTIIWDAAEETNRLNHLLALSRAALSNQVDVLVWPEAALPRTLARNRETQEIVTALVRSHNVWMIFGAEDSGRRKGTDGTEVVDRFNSAFFVSPAGELVARYSKRHLVAFGEFMPAAQWLPFLKRLRETGAGFAVGTQEIPFQLTSPRARISTLICFEDLFPHLARESVNDDTDLLLNLTNNGWFGESAAQWQHAIGALFRAVENGLPLVRCTNNGLTCWIDARGRIHEIHFPDSTNVYQPGFKLVQIPLRRTRPLHSGTFYHRHGDWFGWGCVALTALGLIPRRSRT